MSDNDTFYRAVPPPKSAGTIQKEKPWHRVAAYCVALGASDSQIATVLGHSRQTIWELRQQPWFEQRVAIIQAEHGGQVARRMLEEACPMAVQKLVELMQSGDPQIEARSAVEIVKAVIGNKLTLQAEEKRIGLDELRARREKIEQELKLIRGDTPPNALADPSDSAKPEDT